MIITNLKRVLKFGFVNFWRNGLVSFASVLVMTIALSVIGGLLFGRAMLNSTLTIVKDKVDISVYFKTGASEEEILTMKKRIEKLPEVSKAIYSSREEELIKFKDRHQNDELTLQALTEIGDNPLGASLNIKAKDPAQYEGIAQFLDSEQKQSESSIIDKFNYNRNKEAINALSRIIETSKKLGVVLAFVFVGVATLITFNTIRLTIYMAREEISVMRLVGASGRYIKGPFVVEGIMYGVISAFLTVLIFIPVTYWAGPYTFNLGTGLNLWEFYLANIFSVGIILLISGFIIGSFSSYLAVKKYLKV